MRYGERESEILRTLGDFLDQQARSASRITPYIPVIETSKLQSCSLLLELYFCCLPSQGSYLLGDNSPGLSYTLYHAT